MHSSAQTFSSIQILRALAALSVVLFHSHQALVNIGGAASKGESYLLGFGAVGVHVFFVISGFIMVMTTRFEPHFDAGEFLIRRLVRIYPIYWICTAFYIFVHVAIERPYTLSLSEWSGALLLLPSEAPLIIGPAWTLSFEMFFYLSFAAVMRLGLERGIVVLTIIFGAMAAVGFLTRPQSPTLALATNSLLLEFILGMGIGWLYKRGLLPKHGFKITTIALVLFGIGLVSGYSLGPSLLIWGVPSALLVLGAVCREYHSGTSNLAITLRRLGDSSYVLYLIHILVITLSVKVIEGLPPSTRMQTLAVTVAVSALSMFVAEIVHRVVETPLLARLNPRRRQLSASQKAQVTDRREHEDVV